LAIFVIFLQNHPVDRSFYAIISYSGTSSPEIVSQDPPDWSSRDHDCQNNNEKCLVLNCAFHEYSEVIRPGVECLHIDKLKLLKSEEKYLDESLVYSGEEVSFSLSFGYGAGINGYRYKTPDSPITLPNADIENCGEKGSFEKCTRFEDIKIVMRITIKIPNLFIRKRTSTIFRVRSDSRQSLRKHAATGKKRS